MKHLLLTTALLVLPGIASAAETGTADGAKAMLLKATAAIKADREVALGKINKGEAGFRQGDLYPFCSRVSDGTLLATPAIYTPIGGDGRTLKDSTGKAYGKEMIEGASTHKEGEIFEITYRAPKPGTTAPEYPKVSYITKVGDLMCGVGYYTGAASATGTADEAEAMLVNVIAAVKADRDLALAQMQKGEPKFKDRDLYPFCSRLRDGKGLVSPVAVPADTDVRTLKDPNGKPFGQEIYEAETKSPEGTITLIDDYLFPRPGTTSPAVPKAAWVARIGDLGCGVGFYK